MLMGQRAITGLITTVVLEGVVVSNHGMMTVAVRRPSGEIVVRAKKSQIFSFLSVWETIPLLRAWLSVLELGATMLWAWVFAWAQAGLFGPLAAAVVGRRGVFAPKSVGERALLLLASCLGAFGGVALVLLLPHWLAHAMVVHWQIPWRHSPLFTEMLAFCCTILATLVYYALLLSFNHSRRMLQYHYAAHQVLAAYAAGKPLTLQHVQHQPLALVHCATLWSVVFIWLTAASMLPLTMVCPAAALATWSSFLLKIVWWMVMLGLGFEWRLATLTNHLNCDKPGWAFGIEKWERWLLLPADKEHLEVALAAFTALFTRGLVVLPTTQVSSLLTQPLGEACVQMSGSYEA